MLGRSSPATSPATPVPTTTESSRPVWLKDAVDVVFVAGVLVTLAVLVL